MLCHGCEVLAPEPVHRVAVRGNGTVCNTAGLVRDDEVRVELHFHAKAMTFLAGSKRAVEREHAGLEFFKGKPADRTGHERGVGGLFFIFASNQHKSFRFFNGVLNCFGKAGAIG